MIANENYIADNSKKVRLIDANELLHHTVWLCGGFVGDPYSDGYMDALDKVEMVILEFPTMDAVEVLHGRWKGAGMGDYYCSLCLETVNGNTYKYCPNCGAKMQE